MKMNDVRKPKMTTFHNPSRASWRFIVVLFIFTAVFSALLAPPSRSCLMEFHTVAFVEAPGTLDLLNNYNGDA